MKDITAHEKDRDCIAMNIITKVVYIWAGIQIVAGVSLFVGTTYMATSFFPAIKNAIRQTGENLSEAATALRGNNAFYCASATNLFALSESMEDVARNFDVIGREVMKTGEKIHFDVPVLDKVNEIGYSVHAIGKDIINVAASIRKEREVKDDYRNVVYPQNSSALNDTAETMEGVSRLMQTGSAMEGLSLYVCLLGVLLSLLFVMNGVILVLMQSLHIHSTGVLDCKVPRCRQQCCGSTSLSRPNNASKAAAPSAAVCDIIKSFFGDACKRIPRGQDNVAEGCER